MRHNRWNAGYFEERFRQNEKKLKKLRSVPLGEFIPEELPDGSKGITYGQVGARKLSPRGSVRYLQVINIRDTGIDFAIKPDRIAEGSHNDPERSRVAKNDILITNTAFRGTETLIGRCVVVSRDYGRLNISQKRANSIRYGLDALEVRPWAWLTGPLNLRSRVKVMAGV
jgi:hypothetical protein